MRLYEIKREPVDQSIPYDDDGANDWYKDDHKTEPWRGPHEGRLLSLMLAGKKPAAWVDEFDIDLFKPFVKDGTFISFDFDYGERYAHPGWIITLPGEEWRAKKLQKIYNQHAEYLNAGKENAWHIKMGILLGYSNEDIRSFIQNA